jgi:PAS domain S-box-containing protein
MNSRLTEPIVQLTDTAHIVQLYSDDDLLLDVLCRFIGGAIAGGDGALVVATKAHHHGLQQRLKARGIDAADGMIQGCYVAADAEELLPRFMVDGHVDASRFTEIVGDLLSQVRPISNGKESRIAVFGELVALLWADGKPEEALRVEQLWNELAQHHRFSLLCAYPMNGFENDRRIEPFLKMCSQHSGTVPSESYFGLSGAEERLRTIAELQQKTQALESALRLRQSEERFKLLVEAVQDYAIFMLDPSGNVASWNAGAQRIKGYMAAEIIGKHFSIFYPQADLQRGKPAWELRVAAKEGRFEDEGWRIRKDGSRFWASVVITAIRDESGQLIGFGKVTRDFTERMEAQEALRRESAERREAQSRLYESEASLRQLSRHLLRTQDEERRRIGRELHDSLGQSLAAIKITLDSLSSTVGADSAASGKIADCIGLAENSIREVRTMSYLLHPPMLEEMGLESAIPWYLDGFSARSGIEISFEPRIGGVRLPRHAELALFRVLQESLTNIHRHSESRTAEVRLFTQDEMVVLEIQDYGKGMPARLFELESSTPRRTQGSGVGLRGMYERMLELGGKLEVSSTEKGTTICASIPAVSGPPGAV